MKTKCILGISDQITKLATALYWLLFKMKQSSNTLYHTYPLDITKRTIEFACSWPSHVNPSAAGQMFHLSPVPDPSSRARSFFTSVQLFGPIETSVEPADGLLAIISSDQVLLLRIEALATHMGLQAIDLRAEMAALATPMGATKPNIR